MLNFVCNFSAKKLEAKKNQPDYEKVFTVEQAFILLDDFKEDHL